VIVQSTRINRCGGYRYIEAHLLDKPHDNERVEVLSGDRGVFADAQALADAKKCKFAIRHLSISPDRAMSPKQLTTFIRSIDREFAIGDQRPRLVVLHQKCGRVHFHIAIAEVDPVTGRVLDSRHDYARLERLAREYEVSNDECVQLSRAERAWEKSEGFSSIARHRAERIAVGFDRTRLKLACSEGSVRFHTELRRQGLEVAEGHKGLILVSADGEFVAAGHRATGMKKNEFKEFWETSRHVIERPISNGTAPRHSPSAQIERHPRRATSGQSRPDWQTTIFDPTGAGAANRTAAKPHRARWTYFSALAFRRSQRSLLRQNLARVDLDELLRRAEEMAVAMVAILLGPRERLQARIGQARSGARSEQKVNIFEIPVLRHGR
jgi:hypothetical protein